MTRPGEMIRLLCGYVAWMESMRYSPGTISGRKREVERFITWAEERSLGDPRDISAEILIRYRHFQANKPYGRTIKPSTQCTRLQAVKEYFRWMTRHHHLLHNPAEDLEMPRIGSPLPSAVLTVKEVEEVLSIMDIERATGLRDRAMFEVFYSSGIRRKELCDLKVGDLDLNRGLIMIREGKGRKDRLIPIGDRAVSWVVKYLYEAREELRVDPAEERLFLSSKGPMTPGNMTNIGHRYLKRSGLEGKGSCHVFRHTMATLMLDGGADLRHVQEMLGHACLSSTQIYTRVAVKKLKDVHTDTHPGARLNKKVMEKRA